MSADETETSEPGAIGASEPEGPWIAARCHPALEPLLPKPRPAREALPDWLKAMPTSVAADSLGGAELRTIKHCPPFLDALALGVMIPLACDLTVTPAEEPGGAPVVSWEWPFPALPDQLFSRAPIGAHAPEQLSGAPIALDGRMPIKFMNFWTLETPPGWSILFTHPLNREDLPFRTLSGVVDTDRFAAGLTHFPALWSDPGFSGVLPAGTPVAQAIPIPRGATKLSVGTQSEPEATATREMQQALQSARGVYRKRYRARR